MFIFWLAILILCPLLLLHSYVIFPMWMKNVRKRALNQELPEALPRVTVIIAAHNEEAVIARKLDTTLDTRYPSDKLNVLIGSDGSTDQTNAIIREYELRHENIKAVMFEERSGKPHILNALIQNSGAEDILILTDADTFFNPDTIPELVKPFSDSYIGGVQADIHSYVNQQEAVAQQEKIYNDREFRIKKGESRHGTVIGAFGACYAIRSSLYRPVPKGFYVDDFFIFMSILKQGYQTVIAPNAVCEMEVSGKSEVQFKRKVRISVGNFQNFSHFKELLIPFRHFAGFAFFSHKVIRWLGPFLMLFTLLANVLLLPYHALFAWLLAGQALFYGLGLLDLLFSAIALKIKPLRFIRHFILMNLALFFGFFRFLSFEGDGKWE